MNRALLIARLCAAVLAASPRAQALDARDVLVLYNTATYYSEASEGVARYYAEARNIPADNLLGTNIPIDPARPELVTASAYTSSVATPVYSYLQSHPHIRVIVLCYGVPYRLWGGGSVYYSVDSQVMLVGNGTPAVIGAGTNAYCGADADFCAFRSSSQNDTVIGGTHYSIKQLVCRLDGYSSPTASITVKVNGEDATFTIPASVKGTIDRAKHADELGHAGIADAKGVLDDAPESPPGVGRVHSQSLQDAINAALTPITGQQDNVHREPGTQNNTYSTWQQSVLEYSSSGWYDQSAVGTTVWFRPRNTWLDGSIGLCWMVSNDAYYLRDPYIASPSTDVTCRIYSYLEPDTLKVLAYHVGGAIYSSAQYDGFPFTLYSNKDNSILAETTFASGVARITGLSSLAWPADDHGSSLEFRFPDDDPYHPGAVVWRMDLGTGIYDSMSDGYTFKSTMWQSSSAELIRDGCTATIGNVNEPTASGCVLPSLLFPRYTRGYSFGEAAWMSIPWLPWRTTPVGDPLMAPCAWHPTVAFADPTPDEHAIVTGNVSLKATATADGDGGINRVEFWANGDGIRRKIGSDDSSPYECTWNSEETESGNRVYPDGVYTVDAVACQSGNAVGESMVTRAFAAVNDLTPLTQVADLSGLDDGEYLVLSDIPVAAGTGPATEGALYVEDANRISGIRVTTSRTIAAGNTVSIHGILHRESVLEQYVEALDVATNGEADPPIAPLGFSGKDLGGAAPSGTPGVDGAIGVYNTGLLVRPWGEVTYVGDDFIYLDDGCGVADGNGLDAPGVRVFFGDAPGVSEGDYIGVTGASSIIEIGENNVRLVRAVAAAEVYQEGGGLMSMSVPGSGVSDDGTSGGGLFKPWPGPTAKETLASDWFQSAYHQSGCIGWVLTQPDGALVDLKAIRVVSAHDDRRMLGLAEWFEPLFGEPRLMLLLDEPIAALSSRTPTIDIIGSILVTLSTGQRALVQPQAVDLYTDARGRNAVPLPKPAGATWQWKTRLAP